jgi:hypothetical protein
MLGFKRVFITPTARMGVLFDFTKGYVAIIKRSIDDGKLVKYK